MTQPVKPGWKTTEFWLTVSALCVSVLVTFHVVPAADAPQVGAYLSAAVTSAVALFGALSLAYRYVQGRQEAKGDTPADPE